MRLIRSFNPEIDDRDDCAVAVGNFDGFHRGHRSLIDAVRSNDRGLASAVMCFEPLPATFFRPDEPVRRLLSVRDRIDQCQQLGLDLMFLLRFNAAFARQSPERFVREVLVQGARARRVVVGSDFRFGSKAAGDVAMLKKLSRRYDFDVEVIEPVVDGDERVSSSRIRERLAAGNMAAANELLGWTYAISGRVLRGQALGRELGFATVNLRPPVPPVIHGIFAVRVSGSGLDRHPGVASIGQRPTVNGRDWLLEVHLFDYDGDLYGHHLKVEFRDFIRDEQKFDDLETMKYQMLEDAERARNLLEMERDHVATP